MNLLDITWSKALYLFRRLPSSEKSKFKIKLIKADVHNLDVILKIVDEMRLSVKKEE